MSYEEKAAMERSRPVMQEIGRLEEITDMLGKYLSLHQDAISDVLRPMPTDINAVRMRTDEVPSELYDKRSTTTERLSRLAEKLGNMMHNLQAMTDRVEV